MAAEQPGHRADDPVVSPKRTNARDLAGRRFGRLRVVEETDRRASNGAIVWRCDCDCGARTSGNTQSCGCWQVDRTRAANTTHA